MIRKLRLKFVIINMAIVTAMLCVIFGLIYHSTRVDLEQENLNMMRAIASFPALDRPGRPDEPPEEVRLPYFTLQIEADGTVSAFGGGYYDLSDGKFLQDLADKAAAGLFVVSCNAAAPHIFAQRPRRSVGLALY